MTVSIEDIRKRRDERNAAADQGYSATATLYGNGRPTYLNTSNTSRNSAFFSGFATGETPSVAANDALDEHVAEKEKAASVEAEAADSFNNRVTSVAEVTTKQNTAQELDAITQPYNAFRAQTGETLVVLTTTNGRVDVIPVQSEVFARRLKLDLLKRTGKPPSNTHVDLIKDIIIDSAEHRVRRVHKRVALDEADKDEVIIDLGDDGGQRLRITAQGWHVEAGGDDILFRRGNGYGTIDVPDTPDNAREAWSWLQPLLLRVPVRDRVKIAAWLVATALGDADYPIVLLVGPEGSAKTTLAQSLATILDPPQGLLPTISADSAKDIIAGTQRRHVCVLDNAPGRLNGDVEDTLCRISTGAQFDERMLYTNFEVASAELHAPLIVTAITHPFRQRDTRNRTIAIAIEALRDGFKRRTDATDDVDQALARIRGAVLFFVSAYLRNRETILTETVPHRMVDWAVAGEAIGRELGLGAGKFFEQITRAQRDDARDYLEGDLVGNALMGLLRHWGAEAKETEAPPAISKLRARGWAAARNTQGELTIVATPAKIQKELRVHARPTGAPGDRLPETARATAGAIQRLQGVLNRAGVQATNERITAARFWRFAWEHGVLSADDGR